MSRSWGEQAINSLSIQLCFWARRFDFWLNDGEVLQGLRSSRFHYRHLSQLIETLTFIFSGISSVVRRCIDKETGKEYAAKIIDIGAADSNDPQQMLEATRQEINILRQVMGHAYISEC